MADNKDRRHHHRNSYLFVPPSSSTGGGLLLKSSSSNRARGAAAAEAAAALAPPPPPSAGYGGGDAGAAFASCSSSSSSKKKLKVILKLSNSNSSNKSSLPASSSSAFSSPSSDPYGSSPPSQNLPDHSSNSVPSPKLGSVTSAPKKIPSASPPLPTSHRSALPFPAAVATAAADAVPASFLSATVANGATLPSTSRVAASASVVAAATTGASAVSSWAPAFATLAVGSASEEAGEEGADEKPSKKRKVKSVSDPQLAAVAVSAATFNQGKSVHPERLTSLPQRSSNLLVEATNAKGKDTDNVKGTLSISRLPIEQFAQPLLSKKVLEDILDKLQKKDIYGVFSEPVDVEEVPDYYKVIKEPMDFGTMRMKIDRGDYFSLDLFQKDIFLVCGNAMRYNARDTIYYKQARSILDTARKVLESLRTTGSFVDRDRKAPGKQRAGGSSTKKFSKKAPAGKYLFEGAGSDYVSGATLASGCDAAAWLFETGKCGKWLMSDKSDGAGCYLEAQTVKGLSSSPGEFKLDQQDDLAGSLLKSSGFKDGRKPIYDENRRNTYKPHYLLSHEKAPVLAGLGGEQLQLIPFGHLPEHAYARSLGRFAADLGPAVWRIAAQRIQKTLPPGLLFGPGWIGEQEAPAGVVPQRLNKEQLPVLHQRDSNTANATENRQSDVPGKVSPVASQVASLSCSTDLHRSSVIQVSSGIAASVSLPRTVCQHMEDLVVASVSGSMPTTEYGGGSKDSVTAVQQNHLSATEPIKLSLAGANFTSDVSQSKLLEMVSQNSRLVPWASGKQLDRISQPHLSPADQKGGERVTEVRGSPNPISNSSSSTVAEVFNVSKHAFGGQRSNVMWVSQSSTSQGPYCQNSNLSSCGPERQQMPQSPLKQVSHHYLTSNCEATSVTVSTMTSIVAAVGRDDRSIQSFQCPQPMDPNHIGNNVRRDFQSQVQASSLQNQMQGALPLIPWQDMQTRLGHQQYEYQSRITAQHDNQKLSCALPQFMQHQMPSDMPLFTQQPVQFHLQGSAKTPLIHMGGSSNGDLQDANWLNLQSRFSAPMAAGVPPSFNQPWQFVSLQYPLQQAYFSHSLPPDLNVCVQTPKPPIDPPSSLTDSQQPDLALQL